MLSEEGGTAVPEDAPVIINGEQVSREAAIAALKQIIADLSTKGEK